METSAEPPAASPPGGCLSEAIAAVDSAVEALRHALDFVVSPAELAAAVPAMAALQDRFDGVSGQFYGQLETACAPATMRLRTVGQLVGALTNADPAQARAHTRRQRWLRGFPEFEQAVATGLMSSAHADIIRRRVDSPRTRVALHQDQTFFVDAAQDCSYADFLKVADYWLIAVDPDGEEPAEQREQNHLNFRIGRGGRVHIKGQLDAISGQALRTAIDRLANQQRMATDDEQPKSEAQRRADALVELVTRGATAGRSEVKPLINIVMSQTVAEHLLTEQPDAPGQPGRQTPVAWNDIDGRCELIDGTPIHPHHALRLFGVATLRRHILNAKGRVIDASLNVRRFPEWMRNAIHIESRGRCETPGCDAPHRWIQTDHIHPHSHHGPTSLANAQNQCAGDNHAKTNTTNQPPQRNHPLHHRRRSQGSASAQTSPRR